MNYRMVCLFNTVQLIVVLFVAVGFGMKVSFYGDGYISMPLQEAKLSTNIRIKFRSYQENALIFLAAGRSDHCMIGLEDGFISCVYKINNYSIQVRSPQKIKLNDLEWHDVAVQRYEHNITLQVDGNIVRKSFPSDESALNVHFGVFIGGVGDFPADYLNDATGFRGCLSDVFYNNINIVKRAKDRAGHTTSIGVSWTCSNEFDGTIEDSISFLNEASFAIMSKESFSTVEYIFFEFRTVESSGVLFFNGGYDFVLLEIEDEHLKLLFNKSGSIIQLVTNETVADAHWHRVKIYYSASTAELILDNVSYSGWYTNDTKKTINLENTIFLGGVQKNMRRRLLNKGLLINDISFKGCIREVQVNNKQLGFPQMKISQHLSVKCAWKYHCVEHNPCLNSGICSQHGVDEFICYCDQAYCIRAEYQGPFKIFTEQSPMIELLYISPLNLLEGGTAFISPNSIDVLLDKRKYAGVNDMSIIFHVIHQPHFGQLQKFSVEKSTFVNCRTFNIVELSTDKVKYVHNGMENFSDHIAIDMQIHGDVNKLPDNILGKHRFLLHANITPVNDPPQLRIPSDKILRAVEGVEKLLDVNLFSIQDPDSSDYDLIYASKTLNHEEAYGHFLLNEKPTSTFSQEDVNLKKVTYLYNYTMIESVTFQILLQVSDGIETSDLVSLPVAVHPLELRLINNTGLIMIHKSSQVITSANLSFNANADNIDIRYDIIKLPQYGTIQKLRHVDSSWVGVEWFSGNQLMLGHVRYIHLTNIPMQDDFKFIASYAFATTQTFDFRITFTRLRISSTKPASIEINGSNDFLLTNQMLSYETKPVHTTSQSIVYKIIELPKYGLIIMNGTLAKEMDLFTQLDLDKNKLRFKTFLNTLSSFEDVIKFTVSVPECEDVIGELKVIFTPFKEQRNRISFQTPQLLIAQEGGRALLNKDIFEVQFSAFENLMFTLTTHPKHGNLCRYNEDLKKIMPLSQFFLNEMLLNEIYYCHDDTESNNDSFEFLILSSNETDFQYVTSVKVEIKLTNDNVPYRTTDKIFHIVRKGMRTVSSDILEFTDADLNTNASDILFTHVSCTNGFFSYSGKYVDYFSQDDITNQKISFHHTGTDIGIASYIVTDRLHEVNGLLEIHASDPYVTVIPSNASIAQEGKYVHLKSYNFIVDTNLDVKLRDIAYEVIEQLSYGTLMYMNEYIGVNGTSILNKISDNFTSLTHFTHFDIENERLVYWNTEVASMDKLRYRVTIKNISAEGELVFRIYPLAYWEPLEVKTNQTLYVEESTSVLISRDILEVVHSNISPGDITFLVTSPPLHGYLEMQAMNFDDEYNCQIFDQSAINNEKMFYIQAGVNQSIDYFNFDVTNGITWLRNLALRIVIIPENLFMYSNVITILEGSSAELRTNDILPNSSYYQGKILEYKILTPPTFGYIMASGSIIKRFTQNQLDQGIIHYVHDGNETYTDVMTLKAYSRNKESKSFEVHFTILPVNDEQPIIATNTGLQIWNGGMHTIRNTDLMVQDYDTPPENLTFYITNVFGGYLTLKSEQSHQINNFTQKQINDEEVVFVHDMNSKGNNISFFVSDGVFNSSIQFLKIEIKSVEIIKKHNEKLTVFPLSKKQILPDYLSYMCSDKDRQIFYTIKVQPSMGRLINENYKMDLREVLKFTQNDLANGRIFYEHTAIMLEFRTNDSFNFEVRTENSEFMLIEEFQIEISVSSGGLLRFLPVTKINVDEGGSMPIKLDFSKILVYLKNNAGINNPEIYIEISKKPFHGEIALGHQSKIKQRYYPSDFSSKEVHYIHDHSDTLEDSIVMSVFLLQGNIFLCNLSIPVSINPVNDQQFRLETQMPRMSLVEGENRTIMRDILLTEDSDTPPEEIVYDVISGPTLGVLKKISFDGRVEDLLVFSNQFTQADINNEKIIYVHFGIPQSTTFSFTVSDGKFNPVYDVFTIKISKISLLPTVQNTPLLIQQGATTALIKLEHINIKTNVELNRLAYNITNSPINGIVLFQHQPTLRFTQEQFQSGQIFYMQTDQTRSNDTFQVSAYVSGTSYELSVDVIAMVEPVIKILNLTVKEDLKKVRIVSALTLNNPLATKLNKYNPKFVITRLPASGEIRKIIRNSGMVSDNTTERQTNSFSYKELRSGIVYFVPKNSSEEHLSDLDSFDYLLLIKTVQPAESITFIKYENMESLGNVKFSKDHWLLGKVNILLCLVVFILFIVIFMIILIMKLFSLKCNKGKFSKNQPPTLPCPPDLTSISPQTHPMNYSHSDKDSSPLTPSSTPISSYIPQCKVAAINPYPTLDLSLGVDDESDDRYDPNQMMLEPNQLGNELWCSSCDIGNENCEHATITQKKTATHFPISNPLLRRNQYWV